jgi:hypothetical protein
VDRINSEILLLRNPVWGQKTTPVAAGIAVAAESAETAYPLLGSSNWLNGMSGIDLVKGSTN